MVVTLQLLKAELMMSLTDIGMNLLSGVTWKGAKLRIGEAKPDYRERCAKSCPQLSLVVLN